MTTCKAEINSMTLDTTNRASALNSFALYLQFLFPDPYRYSLFLVSFSSIVSLCLSLSLSFSLLLSQFVAHSFYIIPNFRILHNSTQRHQLIHRSQRQEEFFAHRETTHVSQRKKRNTNRSQRTFAQFHD